MIPLILGVLASASLLFWAVCAAGANADIVRDIDATDRPLNQSSRNFSDASRSDRGGEKAGNVNHGEDLDA